VAGAGAVWHSTGALYGFSSMPEDTTAKGRGLQAHKGLMATQISAASQIKAPTAARASNSIVTRRCSLSHASASASRFLVVAIPPIVPPGAGKGGACRRILTAKPISPIIRASR
jgi:hypothetical protein